MEKIEIDKSEILPNLVALRMALMSLYEQLSGLNEQVYGARNEVMLGHKVINNLMKEILPIYPFKGDPSYPVWDPNASSWSDKGYMDGFDALRALALEEKAPREAKRLYEFHKKVAEGNSDGTCRFTLEELEEAIENANALQSLMQKDKTTKKLLKPILKKHCLKGKATHVFLILHRYGSQKAFRDLMYSRGNSSLADDKLFVGVKAMNLPQRVESLMAATKMASDIHPLLVKKYNDIIAFYKPLIHPSDYENLDYLIYLFETGRADTMMRALQLLDDERRNKRLIEAIDDAAKYIVENMERIIDGLGSRLEFAIGSLGRSVSRAIDNASDKIVASQRLSSYDIIRTMGEMEYKLG